MAHTVTFDPVIRIKHIHAQEEPRLVALVPEVTQWAKSGPKWAKKRAANNLSGQDKSGEDMSGQDLCLIPKTVVMVTAMAMMLVIACATAGTSSEAVGNILIIAGILGTYFATTLMVEGCFRLGEWCYKQGPYTLPMSKNPRPARMARWEMMAQTGHRSDDLTEVIIIKDTGAKTPMSEPSFWA